MMLFNYVTKVLLLLLIMVIGMTAFTYHVDPYRAFHLQDVSTRSDMIHYLRTIKPYQIKQASAQTLILGSSRGARIRPPQSPAGGAPAYNASLPGMTVFESLAHLQHANYYAGIEQAIIVLDYTSFLSPTPQFQFGFTSERLAEKSELGWRKPNAMQILGDWQTLLLTNAAVANAINLATGAQRELLTLYRDGTWEMQPETVRFSRQHKFLKIAQQYHGLAAGQLDVDHIAAFRALVRYCHEANIDARFVVAPEHLLTLIAYERAGALSDYMAWHRTLLGVLQEVALDEAAAEPFPLIGLHFFVNTAEAVKVAPAQPDFDDGVHTTYAAGERIRQAMMAQPINNELQLTPDSLDNYWGRLTREVDLYKVEHPALLQALEARLK